MCVEQHIDENFESTTLQKSRSTKQKKSLDNQYMSDFLCVCSSLLDFIPIFSFSIVSIGKWDREREYTTACILYQTISLSISWLFLSSKRFFFPILFHHHAGCDTTIPSRAGSLSHSLFYSPSLYLLTKYRISRWIIIHHSPSILLPPLPTPPPPPPPPPAPTK